MTSPDSDPKHSKWDDWHAQQPGETAADRRRADAMALLVLVMTAVASLGIYWYVVRPVIFP